jgi:hypothetical protein
LEDNPLGFAEMEEKECIKILFGGDFRQILPVIPRGSRAAIVNATNIEKVLHMAIHEKNFVV